MHRGDLLLGPVETRGAGLGQVHRHHRLFKSRQHRDGLPRLIQGQAAAVEDELVITPHLVDIDQGNPVFPGVVLEQAVAQLLFAHLKGRGGNINEHRGPLPGLDLDGVQGIEPAEPQLRIVPGVFADGDPQEFVFEGDNLHLSGGIEMPGLIEDVVGGQKRFALAQQHLSPGDQHRAVAQAFARVPAGGLRRPHQDAGAGIPGGPSHQMVQGLLDPGQERRLLQEVPGRIAHQEKLGEDHQVGGLMHLLQGGDDLCRLPLTSPTTGFSWARVIFMGVGFQLILRSFTAHLWFPLYHNPLPPCIENFWIN